MPTTAVANEFIGAAHPTSGTAQIVEENGQRYLEFDSAFSSQAGPDLFVLLHAESVPNSYSPDKYVNLGPLQQVAGAQRYAIPADVAVNDFKSAVIWCRQFDVTFGYATL
ncbi:MAG: electron transfer flavoprotein [Phormidesmis priestleyi]|uniref:Electron transfer flavoprotein n=1 Tax=Phormidesmis priestleyi TaxID=268141 RepID=A0A2W4ZRF4_9CYAN|nr:MAG: electron transfer flavoprotein [Phormidesmis priestleyi]